LRGAACLPPSPHPHLRNYLTRSLAQFVFASPSSHTPPPPFLLFSISGCIVQREKAEKLYVEKVFENREKKVEKATLKSLKHAHAKMQV